MHAFSVSFSLSCVLLTHSESDLNLRIGHERAQRLGQLERQYQRLRALESVLSGRAGLESDLAQAAAQAAAVAGLKTTMDESKPLRGQVYICMCA